MDTTAQHRTGAELRDAREVAGLTQEAVASRLGLSRTAITMWEQRARVVAPKAARYLRAVEELTEAGKS